MITVQFRDFDDMMTFAKQMTGVTTVATKAEPPTVSPAETGAQLEIPVQQAPQAVVQEQQEVPSIPVSPDVPVTSSALQAPPAVSTVPTTTPSYTLDDLAGAAMTLMDSGRRGDLLGLLKQFGVEALPALPPAQYGAFATALRGMGAQI